MKKNTKNEKAVRPEKVRDLRDPKYYINRELSWMQFDERILEEARDPSLPLFERLKFLSITASNLDEFFMIRIASLKDMKNAGYKKPDIAGMTPKMQLNALSKVTHDFVSEQYSTFTRMLLPKLSEEGLRFVKHHEDLSEAEKTFVDGYFRENVYPVLTPMAVDSSRPFPLVRNKTLNIGALVRTEENDIEFAMVQVPSVLPRIVELPKDAGGVRSVILLEEIIERNIGGLFLSYNVICAHPFRVMRNADFTIDEDEADDLLSEIEKQLKQRQRGVAIRLECESGMDKRLLKILEEELKVKDNDLYFINGPLDLTFLMKLYSLSGFDRLKEKAYEPEYPKYMEPDVPVFDQIRDHDILMWHPYESFTPVVRFIQEAARDKDTLAIKQTLYRVSGDSPIIKALAQAAENGKQVTVLVELKARFDEENNIIWAKMLEKAGCHVIYGLKGLKTHSKITLVVRREEDGLRRYVHLGTGNYNDSTAKQYTDIGFLTCAEPYGEDATAVFNMLSGYSEPAIWNKLSIAPLWLKDRFLYLIRRETEHALNGREAHIVAKVNSLCDLDIIEALYQASNAGVKIELIIRGICCLRTGIPGVSENITVRSIVGTYLEHARIFWFLNEGKEEIYCASADWMPRNLERRVEILFPVETPELVEDLKHILKVQLSDNTKARLMTDDGIYIRILPGRSSKVGAQKTFMKEAQSMAASRESSKDERIFIAEEAQSDEDEEVLKI
ncbi:MAG: RNA degradosome polyphosphate kinase [Lachnospiraceae bacterium]|nr:RNA degradosome polyphosphate kinase [Lachnospiraceae bacterium]